MQVPKSPGPSDPPLPVGRKGTTGRKGTLAELPAPASRARLGWIWTMLLLTGLGNLVGVQVGQLDNPNILDNWSKPLMTWTSGQAQWCGLYYKTATFGQLFGTIPRNRTRAVIQEVARLCAKDPRTGGKEGQLGSARIFPILLYFLDSGISRLCGKNTFLTKFFFFISK